MDRGGDCRVLVYPIDIRDGAADIWDTALASAGFRVFGDDQLSVAGFFGHFSITIVQAFGPQAENTA